MWTCVRLSISLSPLSLCVCVCVCVCVCGQVEEDEVLCHDPEGTVVVTAMMGTTRAEKATPTMHRKLTCVCVEDKGLCVRVSVS